MSSSSPDSADPSEEDEIDSRAAGERCQRCTQLGIPTGAINEYDQAKRFVSLRGNKYDEALFQRFCLDDRRSLNEGCKICSLLSKMKYISLPKGPHVLPKDADASWFFLAKSSSNELEIKGHHGKGEDYIKNVLPSPNLAPYSPLPMTTSAVRQLGSSVDYEFLRGCLDLCSTSHRRCRETTTSVIKILHLIDVESREVVPHPVEKTRYLALSYCYGGACLPKARIGKLPDNIPQTIEDAIEVTKNLEIQYLWVDSLCIIESRLSHVYSMDRIYSGAFATIVALDSPSAHDGLCRASLGHSSTPSQAKLLCRQQQLISCAEPIETVVVASPWYRRAWTLQEGLFSRRKIYFSKHLVYYVCSAGQADETEKEEFWFSRPEEGTTSAERSPTSTLEAMVRSRLHRLGSRGRDGSYFAGPVIESYVERTLGKESDFLDALGCFFAALASMDRTIRFYYGLIQRDFASSLMWSLKRVDGLPERSFYKDLGRRPGFPSWSWVGWRWTAARLSLLNERELLSSFSIRPATHLEISGADGSRIFSGMERDRELMIIRSAGKGFLDIESLLGEQPDPLDEAPLAGDPPEDLPEDKYPALLCVRGVLLQLQITIRMHTGLSETPTYGLFLGRDFSSRIGHRSSHWTVNVDLASYFGRCSPVEQTTQGPGTENAVRKCDCLLVQVARREDNKQAPIYLFLLMLEWVDGIAYRIGRCQLGLSAANVEEKLREHADTKDRQFWMG